MSKQVTITLSDDVIAQLVDIRSTRMNRTAEEILVQVIERGCFALQYRTKYNAVKNERNKADIKEFKAWKAIVAKANAENTNDE